MNQSSMNVILIFTAYGPTTFFSILTFLVYVITILACHHYGTKPSQAHVCFSAPLGDKWSNWKHKCFPKIMDHLISSTKESSYEGCLGQVFFINFYASSAYTILTAMAYDRYVSICKPLQYHIMTSGEVKKLLVVVYFFPITTLSVQVYFASLLPHCKNNINKLFCDNLTIVNMSLVKSSLGNIYGICVIICLAVLPLFFVVVSYLKILAVCLRTSKEAQKKALSSCTRHLITFVNFSIASLFSVIYNRSSDYLPSQVNIFMRLHVILIPPLSNPLIYGFRTREIRQCIAKIMRRVFTGSLDTVQVNVKFQFITSKSFVS